MAICHLAWQKHLQHGKSSPGDHLTLPTLPLSLLHAGKDHRGNPEKGEERGQPGAALWEGQLRGIRFLLAFAASNEGRLDIGFYIFICHLSISHLFLLSCESESCSVVSDSLRPHGILQARILEWIAFPFSGDLPNPGIEPRSPALQVDTIQWVLAYSQSRATTTTNSRILWSPKRKTPYPIAVTLH